MELVALFKKLYQFEIDYGCEAALTYDPDMGGCVKIVVRKYSTGIYDYPIVCGCSYKLVTDINDSEVFDEEFGAALLFLGKEIKRLYAKKQHESTWSNKLEGTQAYGNDN